MASIFTRIIAGEVPGRFVWRDGTCVAFLSISPLRPGHTLVVSIEEIDEWLDLDPATTARLIEVARAVGRAQRAVFAPARVGLIIAGMEVPHCHLHVVPINAEADLHFANADRSPSAEALDDAAERLRAGLRADGHAAQVPST